MLCSLLPFCVIPHVFLQMLLYYLKRQEFHSLVFVPLFSLHVDRSEERRVGNECRSQRWTYSDRKRSVGRSSLCSNWRGKHSKRCTAVVYVSSSVTDRARLS